MNWMSLKYVRSIAASCRVGIVGSEIEMNGQKNNSKHGRSVNYAVSKVLRADGGGCTNSISGHGDRCQ